MVAHAFLLLLMTFSKASGKGRPALAKKRLRVGYRPARGRVGDGWTDARDVGTGRIMGDVPSSDIPSSDSNIEHKTQTFVIAKIQVLLRSTH